MRILFVAFPNSVHTARWIHQISDQGWDIHLAPTTLFPPHAQMPRNVTLHMAKNRRTLSLQRFALHTLERLSHRMGGVIPNRLRHWLDTPSPQHLVQTIRKVQPDIIHALVIQHAGYATLDAQRMMAASGVKFPTWIVGNWGSNIYLFGRLASHQERIREVLAASDYYNCECERDVALARQFGFKGEVLPVLPVAGGFDLARVQKFRQPGPTSSRRVILLKGYQHWAGRALTGLRAIELCADVLQGYRVLVQLASPDVEFAADLVASSTGIPIECVSHVEHDAALARFGSARIHLGVSISDGISQSLLEAMAMGAFPIQTDTSCANEWIEDGKSGFLIPPEDPNIIAAALRRAITDDALVDQAVQINDETVRQRLNYAHVKQQTIELYQTAFAGAQRKQQQAQGV